MKTENENRSAAYCRRVNASMLSLLVVLTLLYCCVFNPLYVKYDSDVMTMYGWEPVLMQFASSVCEIVILLVECAWMMLLLSRSKSAVWFAFFSILGLTPLRYSLDLLISSLQSGESAGEDYAFAVVYILLEWLTVGLIFLFSRRSLVQAREAYVIHVNACRTLGREPDKSKSLLPFQKLFSFGNPLQKGLFSTALAVSLLRVAMRVRLDFYLGAPETASEIWTMALYYTLDLLIFPLGYLALFLLLQGLNRLADQ